MRPRIVAVSYLNTIPYIYGITHAGSDLCADLVLAPPSGCAETLRRGEAEIGLVPVAALPSLSDFSIFSSFCIGASGPVRTVVLATNTPLSEIDTVYLDSHSLTSVALARMLAHERWGISPEWKPLTDYTLLECPAPGSAYILIGDKVFENESRFSHLYDLATEWYAHTGLPFVFAAWVARRELEPPLLTRLEQALRYGTEHIPQAIAWNHYPDPRQAQRYLSENIDFAMDSQKRAALSLFLDKGERLELFTP